MPDWALKNHRKRLWFLVLVSRAAEQDHLQAQFQLAYFYDRGMGVKKNWVKARKLLLDPAEEGSALAQYVLGEIYAQGGHDITQNISQARHWYSKARQSGNSDAAKRLKELSAGHSAGSHKKPATDNQPPGQPALCATE